MEKRIWLHGLLIVALALSAAAQKPKTASKKKKTVPAAAVPATAAPAAADPATTSAPSGPGLESVLDQMDRASAEFRSAEADFIWEQYQRVVDETDVQKGRVFFLRHEKDMHMAASIIEPDKKYLLYTDGKLRFYQPRIDQVTEYDPGKNAAEVESFLVLGFGGRGHDLQKSFTVKLAGHEVLDGVKVAKLELFPKSEKLRNTFERIVLWIDPARDISLRQQFFEPSGDFRTAIYRGFRINEKISDDAFKLKTTPKTKVVKP